MARTRGALAGWHHARAGPALRRCNTADSSSFKQRQVAQHYDAKLGKTGLKTTHDSLLTPVQEDAPSIKMAFIPR
jgi:hypothetical protein